MATSIRISVAALAFLAGCGSTLQVGLANAPALGKDTPETRVHDVIANGHDACERSGFPPGEVLRGHVPPCSSEKDAPGIATFFARSRPRQAGLALWHGLGVCAPEDDGFARSEVTLAGISPSADELACDEPWSR